VTGKDGEIHITKASYMQKSCLYNKKKVILTLQSQCNISVQDWFGLMIAGHNIQLPPQSL